MSKHRHRCHTDQEEFINRLIRKCCHFDCICKVEKRFSKEDACKIAKALGVNINSPCFDLDEFWMGLNVELEHGKRYPQTNITNDDPIMTGKIALAHLNLIPDYYTRLARMRREAYDYWRRVRRSI